jgi:hypothetical protein
LSPRSDGIGKRDAGAKTSGTASSSVKDALKTRKKRNSDGKGRKSGPLPGPVVDDRLAVLPVLVREGLDDAIQSGAGVIPNLNEPERLLCAGDRIQHFRRAQDCTSLFDQEHQLGPRSLVNRTGQPK